jgi:hypothetical protein
VKSPTRGEVLSSLNAPPQEEPCPYGNHPNLRPNCSPPRQNAQHSTGPRSAAAKQNSKLNALKHGAYVSDKNQHQAMLALGEDPEQFQTLTEELMSAFGPGNALWEKQIEDHARLYWRRERAERAQAGLNIEKALQSDNMSEYSPVTEAVEDLKVKKQCGNVVENKGSLFQSSRRSGNVIENKGSYAHNAGILLKTKGVIGNAELHATSRL